MVYGYLSTVQGMSELHTSILGYSDTGVPSGVWLSQYSPGNVRVTLAFRDSLTQGYLAVCGCPSVVPIQFWECQSYTGVRDTLIDGYLGMRGCPSAV